MAKKNNKEDKNEYGYNNFSFNKSSEPVDVTARKKRANSKKINKILDDNIDGIDGFSELSQDEQEEIMNNKKSILQNDDKEIEKGAMTLLTNKTLYDKFKNLLKADIAKEVANLSRQLTPNDVLIAKAVAEGMSDQEIIEIFKVDISYIDQMKSNTNFAIEVQRNTQLSALGNKQNRIQSIFAFF